MAPWHDRAAKLSGLRIGVLLILWLPAIGFVVSALARSDRPPPEISVAIHHAGEWSLRFLLLSLAITPARQIMNWPRLIQVRRMIGVGALAWALAHVVLFGVDLMFDLSKLMTEVVKRPYLAVGFAGVVILSILGATSFDAAMRRLGGKRWRNLHRLAYVAALLGVVHFLMQAKFNVSGPMMMAGLLLWLLAWRALDRRGAPPGLWGLVGLAVVVPVATALVEAVWYAWKTPADPLRILLSNLNFDAGSRPALWVLVAALVALVHFAVARRRRPAAAPA